MIVDTHVHPLSNDPVRYPTSPPPAPDWYHGLHFTGDECLEQMAAALRIGSRTLRRRLRAEDRTYQQLVDEVRLQLAIKYLTDTDLTHEHIASRLKFSGAANFRRAFRRWTGKAPSQVRASSRRGMS